ncbi:MAG: single-stranded DNA-binding protein [Candidatus Zhuqueibacterota bacterium]
MANLKMPDINNVLIAGNLTCDPSFRKTTNGTPVANFFIASNRKFKDNNGQWRENVCYVGVVAWYKLAESCYENLKKGNAIIVDGELQSRSWRNDDGTSRNVVEIKARRIQFLNRKSISKDDDDSVEFAEEEDYHSSTIETDEPGDMNETAAPDGVFREGNKDEGGSSEYDFGYKDFTL